MRLLLVIFVLIANMLQAQTLLLSGEILNVKSGEPLVGAIVYWEGTNDAVITDLSGAFNIIKDTVVNILVIDYTGFTTRKFEITNESQIIVNLEEDNNNSIDVVKIKIEKPSTSINMHTTIKVEELSQKELGKAACCNLSESFETNPTVDVSFTDAITGTKQIQLLGLAGPYSLISTGNIPTITGNSALTGLEFIPGQWLESIQLVKGTGSVVNGYNSIAGQINTEYKSLNNEEKIFLNVYGNSAAKVELNAITNFKVTKAVNSGLFVQADAGSIAMDNNNDEFMDNQVGEKIVLMNIWESQSDSSNWTFKGSVKFDYLDKESGQMPNIPSRYLFSNKQQKAEAWTKLGYVFNSPGRSTGLQLHTFSDKKDFAFGNSTLSAVEQKFYANWIYADIISNSNHTIKTGFNYVYNSIHNSFNALNYGWDENTIGAFAEYTFKPSNKFSLVTGGRIDYSTVWNLILTPRAHVRWEISENNVVRFSGGLGTKNPNPFLENLGVFASSRNIILDANLQQEKAWNYGLNYTKKFKMKEKPYSVSFDFYRTDFLNKLITNLDNNSHEVNFYNIKNASYANSFMSQFKAEPTKYLNTTVAYRYYDVQTKFNGTNFQKNPLTPSHRAFINADVKLHKKWNWDLTVNWNGKSRLPSLNEHPNNLQVGALSDAYWLANSQLKFKPNKKWEFYIGAENLFNYQQPNAIIDSSNPFSENFDASLVWGPVFGRKVYGGLKLKI